VCSRKGTWYAWAFIATDAHLDEHYNLIAQYWNLSGSIGNPWEINLKFIHNLCFLSGSMYKHCSLDWLEWSNSDVAQARTWVQHSHFSPLQWMHWAHRTKLCYCAYRLRWHSSRAWKWAPAPKLDHQALAAPPWWLHLGSCGIIPLLTLIVIVAMSAIICILEPQMVHPENSVRIVGFECNNLYSGPARGPSGE
jgi:hypothetical protein